MSALWIVAVNYNGLEDTRKCLHSLRDVTPRPEVVLVDNASAQDPTVVLRGDFPECHFIRNSVNGGWAGGNNTGIRYALEHGADQVLLLNNDTTVAPRLAEALLAAAAIYPRHGVLGPVINFMDEPDLVMTDGCTFNEPSHPGFFPRKPVANDASGRGRVTDVDIVNGCAMMVRADVFRRVGLIDERFFLIHEESDFCLRANRAGFRCGVLGETLVWHKGSSAFRRSGKRFQRYYDARNLLLLLRKNPCCGKRTPLQSHWQYLKYVYYRYCHEREEDQPASADAILQGVCDALVGQFGPYAGRPRVLLPALRWLFERHRSYRSRQAVPQPIR